MALERLEWLERENLEYMKQHLDNLENKFLRLELINEKLKKLMIAKMKWDGIPYIMQHLRP